MITLFSLVFFLVFLGTTAIERLMGSRRFGIGTIGTWYIQRGPRRPGWKGKGDAFLGRAFGELG